MNKLLPCSRAREKTPSGSFCLRFSQFCSKRHGMLLDDQTWLKKCPTKKASNHSSKECLFSLRRDSSSSANAFDPIEYYSYDLILLIFSRISRSAFLRAFVFLMFNERTGREREILIDRSILTSKKRGDLGQQSFFLLRRARRISLSFDWKFCHVRGNRRNTSNQVIHSTSFNGTKKNWNKRARFSLRRSLARFSNYFCSSTTCIYLAAFVASSLSLSLLCQISSDDGLLSIKIGVCRNEQILSIDTLVNHVRAEHESLKSTFSSFSSLKLTFWKWESERREEMYTRSFGEASEHAGEKNQT